jgi:hypothetical protein
MVLEEEGLVFLPPLPPLECVFIVCYLSDQLSIELL